MLEKILQNKKDKIILEKILKNIGIKENEIII